MRPIMAANGVDVPIPHPHDIVTPDGWLPTTLTTSITAPDQQRED